MLTCQVRGGEGVGSWQSSLTAEAAGTRISDQRYKFGKQIFVLVRGLSELRTARCVSSMARLTHLHLV